MNRIALYRSRLRVALAAVVICGATTRLAIAVDFEPAIARYREVIAAELARGVVPCLSVAWIVDGRVVHAAGYGMADRDHGLHASAETIYRAGSISKLFNAIAVMQLVEQGKLDLDAPLERGLSGFRIEVPFAKAGEITIRQLLCHRSGMIRECPVGGYLDPSQPSLVDTVASVANCALVNPPNSKTRYSNVGPTLAGRAVEIQSGQSYPEYQLEHILKPLGMNGSVWLMNDALRPRLAHAVMRVANGDGSYRDQAAPRFELGTVPAGNLYTSSQDLGRFAAWLMGGESAESDPKILKFESLAKMFEVQLSGEPTGFGLGFSIGKFRNHKTVQHTGAVYGFTSSIVVLPDERIGAVVLTAADLAGAAVRRLSESGLELLLETVKGETPPKTPARVEVPTSELAAFAGDFESQSYWATLRLDGTTLRGTLSGQPIELAPIGPLKFVADGRLMHRAAFEFEREGDRVVAFTAAGQRFERVDPANVKPIPATWKKLVGVYGPSFIPLVVAERHGHLYATVENEYDYRLTPVNTVSFNLPPGMYADEQVVFQLDEQGGAHSVVFANQTLKRK